jgi:hypothetical protein
MAHGVRKGIRHGVNCPMGKGMCFTSWDAAEAARLRLGAERVYTCSACGYLHITRYTEAEYAVRIAPQVCTSEFIRGMVDLTDDEGVRDEQAVPVVDQGGQPGPGRGDAGEATQPRGGFTRLAPSPAEVALRVQGRRHSRRA